MQPRSDSTIPWAGAASLIAAGALAWSVLQQPLQLAAIFNTWYLTRAAGLIALILLWASVALGLLQSTGLIKGLAAPSANMDLHEHLSLAAIYATVVHVGVLLFDHYMPFQIGELLIPFGALHEPLWTGLGTISMYLALLVTVSTYLRSRFSARTWRVLHQSSLGGYLFALLHGLFLGTDSGLPWVAYFYRLSAISLMTLLAVRIARGVIQRADAAGRG